MAGVLANLERLSIDFNIFLWNKERGSIWLVWMGKVDSPYRVMEHMNVLYKWSFTAGLRQLIYWNPQPRRPNRAFWVLFSLISIFFCILFSPLTIWPKCSLFSTTWIFSLSISHGKMAAQYLWSIGGPCTVTFVLLAPYFTLYMSP